MFYQLPPAGNPVKLSVDADIPLPSFLSSSATQLYASGTAALAAAIKVAIEVTVTGRGAGIAEIILPAYGCPDLVSAVVYAGAKPVLVDLYPESPWMDLTKLVDVISADTAAIVGVNLFGITERWLRLRELAEKSDIVLIEDSAQYFPGGKQMASGAEQWQGDLVVFSFGRGKPVSLLGGGAVFARKSELGELLPKIPAEAVGFKQQLVYALKARLYNVMISPWLYWLPQSLPFLHLGETRYHSLYAIEAMDMVRKKLLPSNIACYQKNEKAAYRSARLSALLAMLPDIIDLPRMCKVPEGRRLLRYPILVDASVRDVLYQKLNKAGLGASIMYPASLPEIEGLLPMFAGQHFPQAQAFSTGLITLPLHTGVSDDDFVKMAAILTTV